MNNCTKKVACMAIPLFCLNLTMVAENTISDFDVRKAVVVEAASVNQSIRKVTGIVKDEN